MSNDVSFAKEIRRFRPQIVNAKISLQSLNNHRKKRNIDKNEVLLTATFH
jgi:hypothetical protein